MRGIINIDTAVTVMRLPTLKRLTFSEGTKKIRIKIKTLLQEVFTLFFIFFSDGRYIVAGSDDGSIFFWDRNTENNMRVLKGDQSIVNCLQPHPYYCLLASSGIDPVVRLWTPRPEVMSQFLFFL